MRVQGPQHDVLGGADLDDPPREQHGYAVAHLGDECQVVRDEEDREPESGPQLDEHVEHLVAHRNVECGHRLIEDQRPRLAGQGARDGDALALAARKLAREASEEVAVPSQADRGEQLGDPPGAHRSFVEAVHGERLRDRGEDALQRVERRAGVLEDDLHTPAQRPLRRSGQVVDAGAAVSDLAGIGPLEQGEHPRERALPRPGVADQTEDLAGPQLDRDATQCRDAAATAPHPAAHAVGPHHVASPRSPGRRALQPSPCSADENRKHRTQRPWSIGTSAGRASRQRPKAWAQRGAKRQPEGCDIGLATCPGSAGSGARRRPRRRGIISTRAAV